jgi:hypothetical protein
VIRNMEHRRCRGAQLPEPLSARHLEDFPSPVLPSMADLDTYVAMVADEEKNRGLTSNVTVANRPGGLSPQIGNRCRRSSPGSVRPRIVRNQKREMKEIE